MAVARGFEVKSRSPPSGERVVRRLEAQVIRVILELSSGVVAEAGHPDNENYLCQKDEVRFPLLSQVDSCSYAVFGPRDMPGLLAELGLLESEAAARVCDVIVLARRCQAESQTVLSFTPFDD